MDHHFLAAGMDAVPADLIKNLVVIGLALSTTVLGWLMFANRGNTKKITVDDQPVAARIDGPISTLKLDQLATRDFVAERHTEFLRRLDGHDADIRSLYAEIKADRAANEAHASARSAAIYQKIDTVQNQMQQGFRDLERALGRLESKPPVES
jgi:hypothetical protein